MSWTFYEKYFIIWDNKLTSNSDNKHLDSKNKYPVDYGSTPSYQNEKMYNIYPDIIYFHNLTLY